MYRKLIVAALCVAGAGAAQAHAILEGGPVETGATGDFAIRIGHGCDGQTVTGVTLEIPEGLAQVAPMVKPGWTIDAAAPGRVVWSGGALPDGQFDRFVFRATVTAAPGAALPLKVRQTCATAEAYWSEVAAPGVDPHTLAHPAPVLLVAGDAAPVAGHDHAAMGHGAGDHAAHMAAMQGASGTATLGPITVQGGFVRAAASEGGASAAFMTIATTGGADRLIAAASPAARKVGLHAHTLDAAGVARMRPVAAIDVSADAPATLAPGGLHVMMMGLVRPLAAGEETELTLTFEKAGSVTFTAPVIAVGAPAPGAMPGAMPGMNHDAAPMPGHKHGG